VGGIRLEREYLTYVSQGDARERLRWPHSAAKFRELVVKNRRTGKHFISMKAEDGESTVEIHQDGGSRGKPVASNPAKARRTIVSTITSSEFPTILAARREMSGWHQLALEPSAMRSPDSIHDSPHVTQNGAHLGATLFHLARVRGVREYAEISGAAAALTDVRAVDVEFDPRRDSLTLQAQVGLGPMLPARSVSDGTLRFLALCILKADDDDDGSGRLYCMEEPENGIHPARIEAMVNLTRSLAVDSQEPPGPGNPFRQIIVNTHSPRFVQEVAAESPGDILAAELATIRRDDRLTTALRLVPLRDTWRTKGDSVRSIPIELLIEYGLKDSDQLAPRNED
jgi:predicted ATPase